MKHLPSAAAEYGPRVVAFALSAFVAVTLGPVLLNPHVAAPQRVFGAFVMVFFCYMFFRSAARWRTYFGEASKKR